MQHSTKRKLNPDAPHPGQDEPLGHKVYGLASEGIERVNSLAGLVASTVEHVDASDEILADVFLLLGQAWSSFDAILGEVRAEAETDTRLAAFLKQSEDASDVPSLYRKLDDVERRYRAIGGDKAYEQHERAELVARCKAYAKKEGLVVISPRAKRAS